MSGIDLSATSGTVDDLDEANTELFAGNLRVAGAIVDDVVPGLGGLGRTLDATQFYLPLVP